METDFAYEQLSPAAFEQLAVALVESVIGAGLEVYGPGPDGGREATYTGTIRWSATDQNDSPWNGYIVVQVKQCQSPSHSSENLRWISGQLRDEFAEWMKADSRRTQFPQYLLAITNVRLSAGDPGGGIDELREEIDKRLAHDYEPKSKGNPRTLRRRGLRDVKVWHRDKLNTLVTNNASARTRFAPLLALGDVLARIERLDQALPGLIPEHHIAGVLVDHAQTTLAGDRWVRFDEAGDDYHSQSVERVIFDLPAIDKNGARRSVLEPVLGRGDQVLSRSVWRTTEVGEPPPPRHLVITGAPGNGKSTLAKYLTQVYRAAFARNDANEPAVRSLIDSTDDSLARLGLAAPKSPRWPLRVDLAPMAEEMGPEGGPNIRRYICEQINLDSSVNVQPGTLDAWLSMWPSVLLLDGLDEVTHPALRQRVQHQINMLIDKADAIDADLLIVITTRPTGYTPLLPNQFEQIDLDYFTRDEARDYGRHVTAERLAGDPDYRRTALERFDAAVEGAAVERLLKTPLQVLILTVIAARSGPLPANRYELFWNYYDAVFKREAAKPTTYRQFFNHHGAEITALHQRVGMVLHRLCEATREIRGRLHLDELRSLARDRMIQLGHSIPAANELAETMVRIAMHRLVLLAADDDDLVSFDVRSLQELMAGCALVDVSEADQRRNLIAAACSPHWRNAWLFAAGRLFTGADHQRELVLDVVELCDELGHWHGWLYPAGPELAADMLDDGLAADRPNDRRRLIDVVLRVLNGPMPRDPKTLANRLSAATDPSGHLGFAASSVNQDRLHVREKLHDTFISSSPRHAGYAIAAVLLHYGSFGAHLPGQPDNPRRFADMWLYREPVGQRVMLGALLLGALQNYDPGSYPPRDLVFKALDDCNQIEMRRSGNGNLRLVSSGEMFNSINLHAALEDRDAEQELQIALDAVPSEDWVAVSMFARAYWPTASRWPVADRLHASGDSSLAR